MARMIIEGDDGLITRLGREASGFRGKVTRAMGMAAGELREQLKREESGTFNAPTGELGRTIGWKDVQFRRGGAEIDVYPLGSYKGSRGTKPRRAALVGAMVEYKHKNPWNARARDAALPRINSILLEQLSIGG